MSTPTETTQTGIPHDTLAMRLVIARIHAGHHNAASAATAAGVSRQNWANWERGKPMLHQDAMLARIATAMGVDEAWLRDGGPLQPTDYNGWPFGVGWVPSFELAA